MGVDSVVSNPVVAPVLIGKENNPVLQLRIVVSDSSTNTNLRAVTLSTEGTTDPDDIEVVRIFSSKGSPEFSTAVQFGNSEKVSNQIVIQGNLPLSDGVNYFWVSYQLKSSADLLNEVQARCESITVDNSELKPVPLATFTQRIGIALRQHGEDGVDTYRIPGLATTNQGTLIAVYDIRYNSSVDLQEDIDVGMNRSTDGGQTWEPMKVIMDMGEWGGKLQIENGIGDPSVLVDPETNTIWVAGVWAYGHPDERNWFASRPGLKPEETSQFMLVKSEDDGINWSEPINITSQIKDPGWHLLLQGPGKGIALEDGTLVFPAQFKDEHQVPNATLIYSQDHGSNWQIGTGVRAETTEAQVVQLENGDIMINARNNEARDQEGVGRVVATTSDLGQTWTMHPSNITALEEPTCMASLISEAFENYGDMLLFSNPNHPAERSHLTIKASFDEGRSWPGDYWLLLDQGKGRGYSCMTKIDDHTIGILYEGSQADLVFEKVEIAEIVE